MVTRFDVLIVGGGHAGAQAAIALRKAGYAGSIALFTDESEFPYERPPLSKEYLAGGKSFDRLLIRPTAFWAAHGIGIETGREIVAVNAAARSVRCGDGQVVGYGRLIWAAGGRPRRLTCAGHDLAGIHTVRTRADVDLLRDELRGIGRVVVIGGGYIGLEAAAVLTKLGKRVTVLEAMTRVLARVAGEPLSRFYEAEHRRHCVDVRLAAAVDCIEGSRGRVCGVRLADGDVLPADTVIVGIGIAPSVDALRSAGAAVDDGVATDLYCRTSLPDVYAIGDCAAHVNRFAGGRRIRLESVQNAVDQAIVAANHIVGKDEPNQAVPWFWSNQYDLRLQTVGLSSGYDDLVVRGDPVTRRFSIVYLREGRVLALDCVNATRDYVQGRALVVGRIAVPRAMLADADLPLADIATLEQATAPT